MKRFCKILFPILAFLSMAFILSNSMSDSDAATKKEGRVVQVIEEVAKAVSGEEFKISEEGHVEIAKFFHMFEFSSFSFFLSLSLFLLSGKTGFFYPKVLLCGVFLALADEHLQLLSKGRNSKLSDVLVDTAGVMVGYALAFCITKAARSIRRKKYEKRHPAS